MIILSIQAGWIVLGVIALAISLGAAGIRSTQNSAVDSQKERPSNLAADAAFREERKESSKKKSGKRRRSRFKFFGGNSGNVGESRSHTQPNRKLSKGGWK